MAVKFCEQCGTQLGEGAKYCKHCAAPVKASLEKCPVCGALPHEGDAVCRTCGAHLLVEKTLDANKQNAMLRVEARYHPVWIAPAALALTFALAAVVRFAQQLFAGALPREGYLWSSLAVAAFTIAAFYISRGLAIRIAGWRRGEYRADKKDAAVAARAGGKAGRRGALGALLGARPVVAALSVLTAIALIVASPRFDAPDFSAVGDAVAGLGEAIPTPAPAKTPANASEIRLYGVWMNYGNVETSPDGYSYSDYILFKNDCVVFGTCASEGDVWTYAQTGVAPERFSVDSIYDYGVTEASFTPIRNMQGEYLSSCAIKIFDSASPVGGTVWQMSFSQMLTRVPAGESEPGPNDFYYAVQPCTVSRVVPADGGTGTRLVDPTYEAPWGFWVDGTQLSDYQAYDYHEHRDIPFVYFDGDSYKLYAGFCTGAGRMIEWLNDLSDTPSSIKLAAIYDYTIENPTFVLLEGQVFPRIDTCTLRL
ncbi:MAG TPA: zinc ribbon domain-containing protein, partial [Clostridia bacterium]|nr:zinc ribbon domain-containing protein [Clostridia bacterium]